MKPRNSWRASPSFIIWHEGTETQTAGAHENVGKSELIHNGFVNRDAHRHDIRPICRHAGNFAPLREGQGPEFLHPMTNCGALDDGSFDLFTFKTPHLLFHSRQNRSRAARAD